MDSILQILLLFGVIGVIVTVLIISIYVVIMFINRKMGYDVNGNQIRQVQQNNVNPSPQIIRIETVAQPQDKEKKETNKPQMFAEKIEDDIPFTIKNIEDVKIETSFKSKRIGKIE